jgi:hypothetical protein
MKGLRLRVEGLGFRVEGSSMKGLRLRVEGLGVEG